MGRRTRRAVRCRWPLSGRPRPRRRQRLRRHAPPARLTEGVTPADLAAAGIYPTIVRERGEPLDVVTAHYGAAVPYFRAAARDGDGVLLRISCSGAGRRRGGEGRAGYGSAWTCGPTAFDQALPAVASQLVDQVIAPRRAG
ncbi:hypothetical protein GCM10010287_20780 [Streptomyces variabilis]|uniref:Uncharacterized protein n=1 Tax=Streptomyces variabilis TaxID=67372 RepID=A0ABQ2TVH8_9ACTN|nr:DUF1877 family protein [Streptomyces variabilis]GGP53740.1 hypothetical protein GCM10010265_34640 [Streptomyces griseoincarnatus]GGT46913.1 hypothetical protein GCM10010287_20780 [Streptomyces variabilis]